MKNRQYMEIKWHGRSGRDVERAATVLAEILAREGKYVQAMPGPAGGGVEDAYNRLSDSPMRLHSTVKAADIVAVMDPAPLEGNGGEIKRNAGENAVYIVNTPTNADMVREKLGVPDNSVYTLDADAISSEELGQPIANIPMMAVLARCIGGIPLETFKDRLRESLARQLPTNLAQAGSRSFERGLAEVSEAGPDEEGGGES